MKPKTTIRRMKSGRWKCTRPTVGFSPRLVDVAKFDTWPEAIRWANDRTHGGSCHIEQADDVTDWIAPAPRWSPFAF